MNRIVACFVFEPSGSKFKTLNPSPYSENWTLIPAFSTLNSKKRTWSFGFPAISRIMEMDHSMKVERATMTAMVNTNQKPITTISTLDSLNQQFSPQTDRISNLESNLHKRAPLPCSRNPSCILEALILINLPQALLPRLDSYILARNISIPSLYRQTLNPDSLMTIFCNFSWALTLFQLLSLRV